MKNIHVIPTDKPSRLYKSKITQDVFISDNRFQHGDATYNVNIHITSEEEIKEGDWCLWLSQNRIIKCEDDSLRDRQDMVKKIILTTDQDLDGVQAIDDEFLEWFVKNPSCEFVEIKMQNYYASGALQPNLWEYKIIIPQEEPKLRHQQIIDAVGGEDRFRKIAGIKPKQETLEEYIKEVTKNFGNEMSIKFTSGGIKLGAKWQQERMYSEEEVINLLQEMNDCPTTFDGRIDIIEWFQQFKKK